MPRLSNPDFIEMHLIDAGYHPSEKKVLRPIITGAMGAFTGGVIAASICCVAYLVPVPALLFGLHSPLAVSAIWLGSLSALGIVLGSVIGHLTRVDPTHSYSYSYSWRNVSMPNSLSNFSNPLSNFSNSLSNFSTSNSLSHLGRYQSEPQAQQSLFGAIPQDSEQRLMPIFKDWVNEVKCDADEDNTPADILIDRLSGIISMGNKGTNADILTLLERFGFTEERQRNGIVNAMMISKPADLNEAFLRASAFLPNTPQAAWTDEQKFIILHLQKCYVAWMFSHLDAYATKQAGMAFLNRMRSVVGQGPTSVQPQAF